MKTFKDFVLETEDSAHTDLVKDFMNSDNYKRYSCDYSKRDNCGVAAADLMIHAEKKGIRLRKAIGYFKGDETLHSKKDFTSKMKQEFSTSGLDFNNTNHRKQWIENNPKYASAWKEIPHSWTVDEHGKIHDPSGHLQILKSGLAKDLHPSRYIEEPNYLDRINKEFN
jgi:hypothetical protein